MITKKELKMLFRKCRDWQLRYWNAEEIDWAEFYGKVYGRRTEETAGFVAYCAGYLVAKEKYGAKGR